LAKARLFVDRPLKDSSQLVKVFGVEGYKEFFDMGSIPIRDSEIVD
jgi:hypothetical protein